MMQASVEAKIRKFIVENFLYGGSSEDLGRDTSFLAEGLVDSTGVLELVAYLERAFDISVADTEVLPDNLDSIGRICVYVDRKLVEKSGAAEAAGAGPVKAAS
jgi:acyl carrier protein